MNVTRYIPGSRETSKRHLPRLKGLVGYAIRERRTQILYVDKRMTEAQIIEDFLFEACDIVALQLAPLFESIKERAI